MSKYSAFPTVLGVAAIIFGLDQLTKFLVLKHVPLEGAWDYLPGLARLFKITFITNTGAAFGMFPQLGMFLMLIAAVVVIAIAFFHHHLPIENFWVRLCLGLQLGGAMGNLLDRIIHGYVVDFVDIGFWPIFNIADVSIVSGVSILAYHLWNEESHFDDGRINEAGALPSLAKGRETYEASSSPETSPVRPLETAPVAGRYPGAKRSAPNF